MILNSSMLKYSLFLGFTFISIATIAQVKDTTGVKESTDTSTPTIDEVEVIRDYKPLLEDAKKVRRTPDLSNTRIYQPKLNYSTLDKRLNIPSGLQKLTIQEMPPLRPEILTNNYAKIGVGNFNTYLGELYVNTGTDEALQAGFFAKHLGQKGDIEGQKFSEQKVGIFGRSILNQITLTGTLGYNRYATAFYGLIPEDENLNPDPENQTFNDIYFKGELLKNYAPNDDDISYSLKADGYLFSDKFDAKENAFALSGYFNKAIKAFNIGANVSLDLTGVKGPEDYQLANHIARLNPYIRFQGTTYKLTIGANFVSEFGDNAGTNLMPSADIELDIIPEYATLFGGVNGDVVKTSLRTLAQENPYLNQGIELRNSLEKINAYGGIKGNAGATFGYKATAYYKQVDNLPFFVNNKLAPHKFDVIYDDGDKQTTVMGIEGEINVRVSETVSLGGKLNINEYTLGSEERPWFIPKLRLSSNARINISEKVFLEGEILFHGISSAKTYDFATHNIDDYIVKNLPAFADLSVAAEYRINRQFGISVRANNLFGTSYERYLYYPRLGLNVIGGINYSF